MQEREERVQLRLLLNTSTHFPSPLSHTYTLFFPSPFPTPLFHTHTPPSMFIHTQIGWRRIRGSRHDLQQPKLVMVGNIIAFSETRCVIQYQLIPPLTPLTPSPLTLPFGIPNPDTLPLSHLFTLSPCIYSLTLSSSHSHTSPPHLLTPSHSFSPSHSLIPSPSSLLVWWRTMVW